MNEAIVGVPVVGNNGLGRLVSYDKRDMSHPMQVVKKIAAAKTKQYWNANGWWGDQDRFPQCVGFAWAHYIEDGPVTHKGEAPIISPAVLYDWAQKNDEWPGTNYPGTSVRAGAKAAQAFDFISGYEWAWDLDTVVKALLTKGPVVVGTNWYGEMFNPNSAGVIKIGGDVEGGHAYLLNGVNTVGKTIRIKNSWGRFWGRGGHATISFKDMERLIGEYGEACIATEIKKAA